MKVVEAGADPRRLDDWAALVGSSVGALRNRCLVAGLNPRRSLTFARLLRVVVLAEREGWYPEQFLDNVDPRTVDRLLALGCLPNRSEHDAQPTAEGFLARQTLVAEPHALSAVRRALGA